jgi:hypothetical protein
MSETVEPFDQSHTQQSRHGGKKMSKRQNRGDRNAEGDQGSNVNQGESGESDVIGSGSEGRASGSSDVVGSSSDLGPDTGTASRQPDGGGEVY